MTTYIATINIPGYLPMDDDPPTFDTPAEAWQWLRSEYAMSWNDVEIPGDPDDGLPEPFRTRYQSADEVLAVQTVVGSVHVATPGYDGDHDLGLAYSVTEAES